MTTRRTAKPLAVRVEYGTEPLESVWPVAAAALTRLLVAKAREMKEEEAWTGSQHCETSATP